MLYRTMEKTGDELSILGYGCMRLPEKKGRIDEERAARQIRYAIDQGVNYLDTAVPYHMGACEPFLGRILTDGYREKVKLATKLPHWSVRSREDMEGMLAAQLERLKTDRIDYYLIHNLQASGWKKTRDLAGLYFLDRAKADGRIINAGFSFHGDLPIFKEIVDSYDWDFCQIQYNFLDEQNQAGTEGLEYAATKGMGIVVMEPLRGGNLARSIPPVVQAIWNESEIKRTPVEWALLWIWNRPEVTVVLSGMNEEAHIEENLRVASQAHPRSLTGEELELVRRVRDTYRSLMKAECTGCRYCMPCPAEVDIPTCFEIYNNYHLFGNGRKAKFNYIGFVGGVISGTPGLASQCVSCGKCEEKCPQHLPVPDLLKEVARDLEGPLTKVMAWLGIRVVASQGIRVIRQAR